MEFIELLLVIFSFLGAVASLLIALYFHFHHQYFNLYEKIKWILLILIIFINSCSTFVLAITF